MRITLPQSGQPGYALLAATGDNGILGSVVTVLLDARGSASFQLQSMGLLPVDRQINLPITVEEWTGAFYQFRSSLTVAVQPSQHIANTLNYLAKLGWAVLAGSGNSLDEIGADLAFSLLPVVGVWSEIRDACGELLKLWPGGESPNWVAFSLATAGIVAEFTPADAVLDVAKLVVKRLQPGGVMIKAVAKQMIGSDKTQATSHFARLLQRFCQSL